jgi:hypothetical protein
MKKNRPQVIALDVIETLFSLEPIRERLASLNRRLRSIESITGSPIARFIFSQPTR